MTDLDLETERGYRYWLLIRGTAYTLIDTHDAGAGRDSRRRVRAALLGLFTWIAEYGSSRPAGLSSPWLDRTGAGTTPGTLRAATDADVEAIGRAMDTARIRRPDNR